MPPAFRNTNKQHVIMSRELRVCVCVCVCVFVCVCVCACTDHGKSVLSIGKAPAQIRHVSAFMSASACARVCASVGTHQRLGECYSGVLPHQARTYLSITTCHLPHTTYMPPRHTSAVLNTNKHAHTQTHTDRHTRLVKLIP